VELLLPIVLILVGVSLIVAEVYLIPGLNIVGVLGALMVLFAVGVAFTQVGMFGGVMALLSATGLTSGAFWWLWSSGAWDRFILVASLKPDAKQLARDSDKRATYLGKRGTAVTPLRPTGIAEIDGDRIEVVTEGDFISAGSDIKVVAMDRRKYFVRLLTEVKG